VARLNLATARTDPARRTAVVRLERYTRSVQPHHAVIFASSDAPPWAVYAALITAAAVFVAQWLVRLKESRDRRRDEYSKAFAAAMQWVEFPYRIARRLSNEVDAVAPIVQAMHEAQEQIEFHSSWLRSVSDDIADAYAALVSAVKEASRPHIEAAWRREPARCGTNLDRRSVTVEQMEVETLAAEIQTGVQHRNGPPLE
jgi:hypothetical protein